MKKLLLGVLLAFISATTFAQIQNCLIFDGVDDQVLVSAASGLIADATQITMTCSVFPTNSNPVFPDYDGFCGFRNNVDADFYLVQINANRVEARFRNNLGVNYDIVDSTLQLNVWNHYAFIYNEPELTLYRNGNLVGSTTASGSIANAFESFYMGNLIYNFTNFQLTGKLDEVSLWNRALNQSEISCMANHAIQFNADSLKLYFDFNQGIPAGSNINETTLIDRSAHLDGLLNGFTLTGFNSNYVPGVSNFTSTIRALCPGGVFNFAGQNLTTAGTYNGRFPIGAICDSVVELTITTTDSSISVNGTTLIANQAGALYQWVDCNNNFAPITNATLRSFTPTVDGSYAAIIRQGSCVDTSGCRSVLINSLNDLSSQIGLQAFPNPVSDVLFLKINNANSPALITITDLTGKVVYSTSYHPESTVITIQTATWSSGFYNVAFKSENELQMTHFIKR